MSALRWSAVLLLGCGCLPGPWDWSGGMAGSYSGKSELSTEETETGSTAKTEQDVVADETVEIISGDSAMSAWVTVGPCGAVPATWSGNSLTGEKGYDCDEETNYGAGSVFTQKSTIDKLVVTSAGPGAITIEAEWTLEGHSRSALGTASDSTKTVTYKYTGTRVAGN